MTKLTVCLCLLASTLVGCGESGDQVGVFPVTGKVIYRGAPAAGAKIMAIPAEQRDPNVPIPQAVAADDGTFALTSYKQGDGAAPGKYKLAITWPEEIPEGVNREMYTPKDRMGGRYEDADRSPLEITVTEGPNQLEPFDLK